MGMGQPPPPPKPGGLPGLPGLPSLPGLPGAPGTRPPAAAQAPSMQGWEEHQTSDGRKFYHHPVKKVSQYEKPDEIKTPEERALVDWEEYRIWNGREFFYNKKTKVSCWAVPHAVKRARGVLIDEPPPVVEKHHAFMQLLTEAGVDDTSHWNEVVKKIQNDPRYQALESLPRKRQLFAQKVSASWKAKLLASRKEKKDLLLKCVAFAEKNLPPTWELFRAAAEKERWWRDVDETDAKVIFDSAARYREANECTIAECEAALEAHMQTQDARVQWGKVLEHMEATPELARHLQRVGKSTALRLWVAYLDQQLAKFETEPLEQYPQRRQERHAREAFRAFMEETDADGTRSWALMRPSLPANLLKQVEGCRFIPEPGDLLQEVVEERERKRAKTS